MKINNLAKSQADINEHLRAQNAQLEREIHATRKLLGGQKELERVLKECVLAVTQPKPRKVVVQSRVSPKEVPMVGIYSDWHTGDVIQSRETEGFGEYNYKIQRRRLATLANDQIAWATKQRNAYNIQDAALLMLGDWVSGDIHQELTTTNEFPVPVQAVKAGFLMGELFAAFSQHFRTVTVYEVDGDNHGRLTKKPQAKQKGINNWGHIVYTVANLYSDKLKNVNIIHHEGMKDVATIAGWNFLMEHGDTIKSNMGIPLYGILRSRYREAVRRMGTGKAFNYYCLGHFHVPGLWEDSIILNGSLSGTSEYDHSCGRHCGPSQVAFLAHPKHGLFNFTAFRME